MNNNGKPIDNRKGDMRGGGEEMLIKCAWCGKEIGKKKGRGTSHGICKECEKKQEAKEK